MHISLTKETFSMNRNATILTSIAAAAIFAASFATRAAEPVSVEKLDTVTATVTAIDVKKRLVTLKGPKGGIETVEVSPDVRNLEQVKVGDKLVVRYYESMGAALRPKGSPAPDLHAVDSTAAAARAPTGTKPAAAVGTTTTTTVLVQSVDNKNHTVTFSGPDTLVRTVHVKDPKAREFAAKLKKGDQVDLTYTEALAVSVEEVK
jgi:hypothetical protein